MRHYVIRKYDDEGIPLYWSGNQSWEEDPKQAKIYKSKEEAEALADGCNSMAPKMIGGAWGTNAKAILYRYKPVRKQPSLKTLERWDSEGYCLATDGCKVEPDGDCPHGHVSWLVYLNLI